MKKNTFLANTQIAHITDETNVPDVELLQLFKTVFGAVGNLWSANQRWLLWSNHKLIGHTSVQQRWFVINKTYVEGWFVGGVCIHPNVQKSGLGTHLMQRMHTDLTSQRLNFAVLNCGAPIVNFYKCLGYVKVSDNALYIREEQLECDTDPVLAISLKQKFDIMTLVCDTFPFGFEF